MERRRFIVVCVCVCGHPALLNAAHWRYFSQDTSSVSVSNCCGIFCLSSTQKKKTFLVYRIDRAASGWPEVFHYCAGA